jgi:hypothetical protein
MEEYERTMLDELHELEGRLEKIDAFIENESQFKALDYPERMDMKRQREGMRHYRNALHDRCVRRGLLSNDVKLQQKYSQTK